MAKQQRTSDGTAVVALVHELETLNTRRAVVLQRLKAQLDEFTGELQGFNALPAMEPPTVRKRGGRRRGFKMSKEARAKIAAAQRARWAKVKNGK